MACIPMQSVWFDPLHIVLDLLVYYIINLCIRNNYHQALLMEKDVCLVVWNPMAQIISFCTCQDSACCWELPLMKRYNAIFCAYTVIFSCEEFNRVIWDGTVDVWGKKWMARMKERKMGPRVALVYLLSVSHIRVHVCVHDPWMNSEMKNSLTSGVCVWGKRLMRTVQLLSNDVNSDLSSMYYCHYIYAHRQTKRMHCNTQISG